jgi:hypothetical protein
MEEPIYRARDRAAPQGSSLVDDILEVNRDEVVVNGNMVGLILSLGIESLMFSIIFFYRPNIKIPLIIPRKIKILR